MPDVEWQSIGSFSPGIQQQMSPNHPVGTAHPDLTYRCHALESGALAPLPRLVDRITRTPLTTPSNVVNEGVRLIGVHCSGPHFLATDPYPGVDENHTEIFVASEWLETSQLKLDVSRYTKHREQSPVWESVWSDTENDVPYRVFTRPRAAFFASQWSNSASPDDAGPYVLGWVISGHARHFPDDTTPFTSSTAAMPGDITDDPIAGGLIAPSYLVAHQGRFVIFPLYVSGFGDASVFISSEAAYWTKANDATSLDAELATGPDYLNLLAAGGSSNPSGFGVMASLSGSELLLVKLQGGAYILRGDISDATIEHYPYVRSTGLAFNNGCITPVGYMYPVDGGGVWLWSGGETAENVSKHMDPGFWRPPQFGAWGHANTSCATLRELVFFPNNWVFNTDNPGWWRIDDPDDFTIHHWSSDVRSRYIYGTPATATGDSDPVLYEFYAAWPALDYSWQSQPIPGSVDRRMNVEAVEVVAHGKGTIKVTATTREDPVGSSTTFEVSDDDRVTVARGNLRVQGTHVQLRIESSTQSDQQGVGAPIVHDLRWAATTRSRIPNR